MMKRLTKLSRTQGSAANAMPCHVMPCCSMLYDAKLYYTVAGEDLVQHCFVAGVQRHLNCVSSAAHLVVVVGVVDKKGATGDDVLLQRVTEVRVGDHTQSCGTEKVATSAVLSTATKGCQACVLTIPVLKGPSTQYIIDSGLKTHKWYGFWNQKP